MPKLLAALLVLVAGSAFAAGPLPPSHDKKLERNALDTLVASKAALDAAQKDYEDAKITQSRCAYTLIDSGKQARSAAEDATIVYEQELHEHHGDIQSQEGVVTLDLRILLSLLDEIKELVAHPDVKCPPAAPDQYK